MISKGLFYGILSFFILSLLSQIYFHWIAHLGTVVVLMVWLILLLVWLATKEWSDDELNRDTFWPILWIVSVVTIFANVMSFFTLKCTCDFDYTTTLKVFSLDAEDSYKVRKVCIEDKEKAKTADLANFVWEIEKFKECKIPERTKEEINHIKSLSKEDFDRDYENNKKFLLNVVEDCKSDIIRNNLLKNKGDKSYLENYLKEINEFKTKIENISKA